MGANKSTMCQVSKDNSENGCKEEVTVPTVGKRLPPKRPSDAKLYINGEMKAKIPYLPESVMMERQNGYELCDYEKKVKTFRLYRKPTMEKGTSLFYVQNIKRKNGVAAGFGEDNAKVNMQRRRSFDEELLRNELKDLPQPASRRKRCVTETTQDISWGEEIQFTRAKLAHKDTSLQQYSDPKESHDIRSQSWGDLKENYQIYSEKSDNMLTKQISDRYNSTTFLQFSQFFLTRNGRKFSVKLTEEQHLDFVTGPREILWQKLPKVLESGCLAKMTKKEIKLQEALFEIIYSEGRYLHSLRVLQNHFIRNLRAIKPCVTAEKKLNEMFSKIQLIVKPVEIFMEDMTSLLDNDEMMHGLCDIIDMHYRNSRDVYLKYAVHSKEILNLYNDEFSGNPKFAKLVTQLSDSPEAEKLQLDSFLYLPIKRITQLPLLLKSVIHVADASSAEYQNYYNTFVIAEELANECNYQLGKLTEWEEMLKITQELEFPPQLSLFPLGTSSRKLCIRSVVKSCPKHMLHHKDHIEMFLFNDLFLFAKKHCCRGCKRLQICEYCPRPALKILHDTHKNPLKLHLLLKADSQGKESTLEVLFESMSERQRWVTALTPPSINPIEGAAKQVIVKKKYAKKRPDELDLEIGDLINIIHENGGWCNGSRLIDGETGWFPLENCLLIMSEWIRNANARLCYGIQMESSELESLLDCQ